MFGGRSLALGGWTHATSVFDDDSPTCGIVYDDHIIAAAGRRNLDLFGFDWLVSIVRPRTLEGWRFHRDIQRVLSILLARAVRLRGCRRYFLLGLARDFGLLVYDQTLDGLISKGLLTVWC